MLTSIKSTQNSNNNPTPWVLKRVDVAWGSPWNWETSYIMLYTSFDWCNSLGPGRTDDGQSLEPHHDPEIVKLHTVLLSLNMLFVPNCFGSWWCCIGILGKFFWNTYCCTWKGAGGCCGDDAPRYTSDTLSTHIILIATIPALVLG